MCLCFHSKMWSWGHLLEQVVLCQCLCVCQFVQRFASATMSQTGKMLSAGRVVSEVTGSAVSVTPLPDGL